MALIPQTDIAVTLHDAGYALPIATEGDGSKTFGAFGLRETVPGAAGLTLSTAGSTANYPVYNSGFGATLETPQNFALSETSRGDQSLTPSGIYNEQGNLHNLAGLVLILDITNIFSTGGISAKVQTWPGTVDYTNSGMVALSIPNPSIAMSYLGTTAVKFSDGSYGWCISATANLPSPFPSGPYLLFVKTDLTTTGWFSDKMNATFGVFASSTFLSPTDGLNYQVDYSALPTVNVYTASYDFVSGQTVTAHASGDVSADASNAFTAASGAFLSQFGCFGIDSVSGNNTGCWYCDFDCSAFGKVIFTMPDGSLGPSGSPSVWNVFNSALDYTTYPQVDLNGLWWWVRLPLCDASGNIIIEPLTSEVYFSGIGPVGGKMIGTFAGFTSPGHFGGGTK